MTAALHALLFRNVPCVVEPELVGDARCCKTQRDEMCDILCTSHRPFYARLLPDLPYMYARENPPEAVAAYLTT